MIGKRDAMSESETALTVQRAAQARQAEQEGEVPITLPADYVPWSKCIILDAGFGSFKLAARCYNLKLHCIAG